MIIGFHGYAESAEAALERLHQIPQGDRWLLVAVQALHRFYRGRTHDVVASWMTSQNRDAQISDNLAYVAAVLDEVSREQPVCAPIVLVGFSQGVSMAFRSAVALRGRVSGVIALGGDVPPEVDTAALATLPAVLMGRGVRDTIYTAEKLASDLDRLTAARTNARSVQLDAGHEWTAEFSRAAGEFLSRF